MYFKLSSFSPVSQFVDIVQYLCRNALKDVIPEFFALHHLAIMPINHSELHPIFALVQLPPVYLLCRSDRKMWSTTTVAESVSFITKHQEARKKKKKRKRGAALLLIGSFRLQHQYSLRLESKCSVHCTHLILYIIGLHCQMKLTEGWVFWSVCTSVKAKSSLMWKKRVL